MLEELIANSLLCREGSRRIFLILIFQIEKASLKLMGDSQDITRLEVDDPERTSQSGTKDPFKQKTEQTLRTTSLTDFCLGPTVKCFPSMPESLGSILSTEIMKTNKEKNS